MADAKSSKPGQDDPVLEAVEATEPVILQEPERIADTAEVPATPMTPTPPKPAVRRGGLTGFLLGGAVVAAAGFAAARYALPDTGATEAIAALQTRLQAAEAVGTGLKAEISALSAQSVDPVLDGRIAALESAVAALPDGAGFEARLTTLEQRLSAIEAASAGGEGAPAAALAAMDREMKALRAEIEAQKGAGSALTADIEAASAAAQARLDAAEAGALAASRQAALSHVRAAFESGAPLTAALDGLAVTGAEIPESLSAAAEAGIPSLTALQTGFAEPARAALDASIRADMGESWGDRLTSFLRSQSGARSLTPREGTDPDAVLSRAEAALRDGQIKVALTELAGLPPDGVVAMAQWVAQAQQRLDAEQAIADLAAALNAE